MLAETIKLLISIIIRNLFRSIEFELQVKCLYSPSEFVV